ncbi:hypothetical protein EDB85DRAFT_2280185 [Lactarius pseudohatsudake]|nr:hypothetical protein EDB85DRAFT_2280185 [Lactarius pseudohatsudake]
MTRMCGGRVCDAGGRHCLEQGNGGKIVRGLPDEGAHWYISTPNNLGVKKVLRNKYMQITRKQSVRVSDAWEMRLPSPTFLSFPHVRSPPLCPLPPFARNGGAGQTRERGLRKKKGHAPPFARNGGATGIPPVANRTRGTSPRSRRSRLRAREEQERGAARDRTRDAGRRGGRHAQRPFPPLTGDRARNASGDATAPLPVCARGDENGRASTPLAPRRRLHAGSARMGGGARSNLERRPLLPGLARGGNARTGTRKSGAPPLEPLPAGSCARARIGDHAEAPPLPPLREPGSPPPVCTPGAHGRVVHDRAACESGGAPRCPVLLCTQERHAYTRRPCVQSGNGDCRPGTRPHASIRAGTGEPHGKGAREPGAAPPLTPAQERRANGRGRIGRGCAQRVRTRERGVGCAPLSRRPLRGTEGRGARTQTAACGGLYGSDST